MLFATSCPEAEKKLLQELKQTSDAKWYRRVKLIHLSSQKTPGADLSTLFDCCQETVRRYIKRYNRGGRDGLRPQASHGAPVKIPLTKAEWEDLLHQSPCQCERLKTGARNWTQALLVTYLQEYKQVTVTQVAVSLCLKHHKISWNRGALKVTSLDPLYTVKRERIAPLKESGGRDHKQP